MSMQAAIASCSVINGDPMVGEDYNTIIKAKHQDYESSCMVRPPPRGMDGESTTTTTTTTGNNSDMLSYEGKVRLV